MKRERLDLVVRTTVKPLYKEKHAVVVQFGSAGMRTLKAKLKQARGMLENDSKSKQANHETNTAMYSC